MKVGTTCQRLVSTVNRSDEVSAAARLMREVHVGYLVVVETDALGRGARPIGVLTDRDLFANAPGKGRHPERRLGR